MASAAPPQAEPQPTAEMKPRRLRGHESATTCCLASPSNPKLIFSSDEDGRVCVHDLRREEVLLALQVGEDAVSSICFGGNENTIYASSGIEVKSFDIRVPSSWKQLQSYNYNKEEVNQIAVSHNSSFLAAADDSGDVKIIDIRQQCVYKTLRSVHKSICSSVQFLSWKPWSVITGGLDLKLAIWDFSKGCPINILDYGLPDLKNNQSSSTAGPSFNPAFVHSIAVSEAESSVVNKVCAVARGDGVVDVMDVGSELASVRPSSSSKPRKGSLSTSKGKKVQTENANTDTQRKRCQLDYTLGGHTAAVSCVSFSTFGEKGRHVISGGNDAFVKIWNLDNFFDMEQQSCNCVLSLSINTRRKFYMNSLSPALPRPEINWLCTSSADSENLIICDTSKIVKVYTIPQ